ncbi:hypothetical protein ACO1O0_008217 [Amphichorda felina]
MARKSTLWSQTNTLSTKNLTILFGRHLTSTLYTAIFLPVIFAVYLGILQNVGGPRDEYGIPQPRELRSLSQALADADSSRDTVVFVHNGHTGGAIEAVINSLSGDVIAAGKTNVTLASDDNIGYTCRSSYQGASNCFGAVVFNSSPDEGDAPGWNYTLRGDPALGRQFKYKKNNNDAELYTLPLQRAVDQAIARQNGDDTDLGNTMEWPFTAETEGERAARIRRNYQKSFTQYNSITMIVIFYGLVYRLPGMIATEREKGLSQLIDAMMPSAYDWEPQLARMLSFLYSYVLTYFPGWVASSIVARFMLWKNTNVGVILVFYILAGLALTSQAIVGGTPFKKAQLSGPINAIVVILLAVVAQAIPNPPTAAVAILSVLFAPCNTIFFFVYVAKFEKEGLATDLLHAPPDTRSSLPGIAHWIFFGAQFFIYPVIAAFLERSIHGVAAESRKVYKGQASEAAPEDAVQITGLTKIYRPSLIRRIFSFIVKPRAPTVAVNNLNLSVKRGQILSLLGANGSGKSTTLDAVAGISRFNQGSISIDASGGIGIAPQKNVLWDDLTVYEHLSIFNQLKSPEAKATKEELNQLIAAVGLTQKRTAKSHTLSGGQKRKLQLGMMLTGGSAVCCVDEVSSGIDPLSRRKIWDILLSERGRRTIIMTTHFLDEADLLSDDIAILSKGTLRAQGSPVALKDRLGAGYRVHVLNAKNVRNPPSVDGVSCKVTPTNIEYTTPSSQLAADVIRALEAARLEYRLSSPTIEDVFLHVAEEVTGEATQSSHGASFHPADRDQSAQLKSEKAGAKGGSLELLSGRQTSFLTQTAVLLRKRFTLLKTNWIPYVVAFLIPIIAAAATHVLIKDQKPHGCTPADQSSDADTSEYTDLFKDATIAVGPKSSVQSFLGDGVGVIPGIDIAYSDSFSGLQTFVEDNRRDVNPGGWWAGTKDTPPTIVYTVEHNSSSIMTGFLAQNYLNRMRTNVSINAMYLPFDSNVPEGLAKSLMVMAFFCIAVSVAPAFFGFYPNVERRNSVRGLQYSSGVRSLPLWVSHLSFDFAIFAVAFIAAAIAYAVGSDIWYMEGYLFPVFLLYGLCTILLAYTWSLFMESQLATFAGIFVYNLVGFAIYFIAFLLIISSSPVPVVDRNILIGHYVISLFFPIGSMSRALMVGTNLYGTACDGYELYSYPGHINAYGGPILYLTVQSILLFLLLLYQDSGNKLPSFMTRKKKHTKTEAAWRPDEDLDAANAEVRVHADENEDGLQVKNLVKVFGNYTAVDNVTFGVQHGEVFALLGPNGAGKSTTISLIRGDLQPSRNGGDVFVENISVTDHRALARSHLGVCPQFDALDNMTVLEHLRHYARLRGIADVERQVQAVVRAVGLEAFINTMGPHLSGGNKRKLSLGIALTGNPSVILLDEPSSGLDAAAKRIMWRTLETVVPGRSILLTTHSMEEADALASRAGILARRMLAVGEVDSLRSRFGDSLYVHLISKTAPYSTPTEMERMRAWIMHLLPSARIEAETYHGQMRFSVPASAVRERARMERQQDQGEIQNDDGDNNNNIGTEGSAIGQLILMLEENKELLGIEHHSVSPTTLNDVFLSIVGQHNVQEEGYSEEAIPRQSMWLKLRKLLVLA